MYKYIVIALLGLVASASAQTLKIHADSKGRYGYIDGSGNMVVSCKYEVAFPFTDSGVAKVGKGEKYGLVDVCGKEILPVKYDAITEWSKNVFKFQEGKKYGLIATDGRILLTPKYSFIGRLNCSGKAWIAIGGSEKNGVLSNAKVGVVDDGGKLIVMPEYTRICEFNVLNGRPNINGGKVSLSDTLRGDGKYFSCFSDKKNVVINDRGETLTPMVDKAVYLMPSSGMCAFSIQNGKKSSCGYWDMDNQKRILLSENVSAYNLLVCTPFTGNIAKVENPFSGVSYFIDKTGKKIAGDYSKVKYKSGCWIVYDKSKSCALLNEEGHFICEGGKYQDLKFPNTPDEASLLLPAKSEGKWGVVNVQGNEILPFEYDDVEMSCYGWIFAVKDGRHGVIDEQGRIIVPFDFIDIMKNEKEKTGNFWVYKEDSLYYNYDVESQRIYGDGVLSAMNFKNGFSWVVPQNLCFEENSINRGLCQLYGIKSKLQRQNAFGILVDGKGKPQFSIPVPKEMFSIMESAIFEKGRALTVMEEKRLLLSHTRAVRSYGLREVISSDEWDY